MPTEPRLLSAVEIEAICASAARSVLRQHYALLGYNIEDAADVKQLQADFGFLRTLRGGAGALGSTVGRTIVVMLLGGVAGLFALGIKAWPGS